MRGHAIIVNMTTWIPFVFLFNPTNVDTSKNIHYAIAPNIGGSYKKKYFAGFDAKEINFSIMCVDMHSPFGVLDEIAFFESLREPNPGPLLTIASINENYPPPKVLFQFGQGLVPLVWDVVEVKISQSHYFDDLVRGIIGIPKKCEIGIRLSLDEDHILYRANQIAKQASAIYAGVDSIVKEARFNVTGIRKERAGIPFKKPKKPDQINVGGNS